MCSSRIQRESHDAAWSLEPERPSQRVQRDTCDPACGLKPVACLCSSSWRKRLGVEPSPPAFSGERPILKTGRATGPRSLPTVRRPCRLGAAFRSGPRSTAPDAPARPARRACDDNDTPKRMASCGGLRGCAGGVPRWKRLGDLRHADQSGVRRNRVGRSGCPAPQEPEPGSLPKGDVQPSISRTSPARGPFCESSWVNSTR